MGISNELKRKLEKIINFLKEKKAVIAFSGGIDSSLLGFLSKKYAKKTLLVIGSSVLFSDKQILEATQFADQYNIPYIILELEPLEDELFTHNPPNRCYICKKMLYSEILNIKEQNEYDIVIDGTNITELKEHRPGYKAIKELGISTPYIDYDIEKRDIRALSAHFNLKVSSKPANACFATRIEYGLSLSKELLKKIKSAENFLKKEFNLTQVRVRYHQGDLVRIELLKKEIFDICDEQNFIKIEKKFKELGFTYITLDLEGFESGSMNRVLNS